MKTIFSKLFLIAVAMVMSVTAIGADELGSSCLNPIPLTEDFKMTVTEPGSYWFSAGTYDLPLKVRYTPEYDVMKDLYVYVDFSCTTGVYDDPNLVELTDMASGWGLEMPIKLDFKRINTTKGEVYELSVQTFYRELMQQFGISYDVEVKVEVPLPLAGVLEFVPDTVFRNCIESSHWVYLPDTVVVDVATTVETYLIPISDWVNDSVRFTWTGTKYPATLWLGEDCDFVMDEDHSLFVGKFELQPVEGENFIDFTPEMLKEMQTEHTSLLYAQIISLEKASFIFDYKPLSPEMERAIKIKLDQPTPIYANQLDQYYYFDADLEKYSLQFAANLKDTIVAHFGTTPTFELQSKQHITSYTLYPTADGSELALSKKQVASLASSATSDHIFVTFDSPANTKLTLSIWDASPCASNSTEILPNGSVYIAANSSSTIYRIDYSKWYKGDVKLYWTGAQSIYTYLADTCSFTLNATNEHVIDYKVMNRNTAHTITKDLLDGVVDRVDDEGYLYFRFNTRRAGTMTFTQTLDSAFINPVEPDLPAVPTTDCSLNSLPLAQGDQVVLNLDSAFKVYRIDYKAWMKSGATLTWGGVEPLHTFVAETCAFALAPYNRYVLAYIPVPAQGNIVLDTAQLAAMEEYVSEDGFLYIRFLTKEEGVLEVK